MFLCQLSDWHRYVEHNCYISIPAVQTTDGQAPVVFTFPLSGLRICLLQYLPLSI